MSRLAVSCSAAALFVLAVIFRRSDTLNMTYKGDFYNRPNASSISPLACPGTRHVGTPDVRDFENPKTPVLPVVLATPEANTFPRGLAFVKSKTTPSFFCFTFHPTKDIFVSGRMFQKGVFDEEVLKFVQKAVHSQRILSGSSSCHVIDAGTNIGIVSLYAAALGCQVHFFQ